MTHKLSGGYYYCFSKLYSFDSQFLLTEETKDISKATLPNSSRSSSTSDVNVETVTNGQPTHGVGHQSQDLVQSKPKFRYLCNIWGINFFFIRYVSFIFIFISCLKKIIFYMCLLFISLQSIF